MFYRGHSEKTEGRTLHKFKNVYNNQILNITKRYGAIFSNFYVLNNNIQKGIHV